MSLISLPFTFSAGAVIIASQHNSNFSTIYSDYNGNITDANISASAAIVYSKLNLTGGITNSDISASAAIVASKLVLTSPGAIGTVAPASGKFTTLEATTTFKSGTTNQGDILYDNGTSIVRLTPGTAGQVLTTNGAAANPSWGTGGGLSFVSKTTVAGGSTTTGSISITNTNIYKVIFKLTNTTAATAWWFRFNNDTGSNYKYEFNGRTSGGALTGGSASSAKFILSTAAAIDTDATCELTIYPQTSTANIFVSGKINYIDTAGTLLSGVDFSGVWNAAAAATSFSIDFDGGSATFSGVVYLYKYALS